MQGGRRPRTGSAWEKDNEADRHPGAAQAGSPHYRTLSILISALTLQLLAIWFVHWIDTHGYLDTWIYRLGARAWLEGFEVYGDDLTPESPDSGTLPFIYPPLALLLFTPLTWVDGDTAAVIVSVVSHAAILVTAVSFARALTPPHRRQHAQAWVLGTAVLLPVITLIEPTRETLNFGQINLLLMALVAADCLTPQPKWPRGLLVGIAAGLKLTPLGFLLFFLLKRDFRSMVVSLATFAGTVVVGALIAPQDSASWWLGRMFEIAESLSPAYAGNLTLRSLLVKNEIDDLALDALWLGGSVLLLGLTVLGMLYALRTVPPPADRAGTDSAASAIAAQPGPRRWGVYELGSLALPLALSLNAILILIVSPISWSHHWVWAAPALATLWILAWRQRWWATWAWVQVCGLVVLIGPQWYLPSTDDQELQWTWSQQIVGNSYTILGMLFLLTTALAYFWPPQLRFEVDQQVHHQRSSTRTTPSSEFVAVTSSATPRT